MVLPKPDYEALTGALKRQCALAGLQPTDYFLLKAIQLYEMVVVRHGLMTVGQPLSGKSSALRMLAGGHRGRCWCRTESVRANGLPAPAASRSAQVRALISSLQARPTCTHVSSPQAR